MKYDFDKVIDRNGTATVKLEEAKKEVWGRADLIPLWVADMDFGTAPFIVDAIRKRWMWSVGLYRETWQLLSGNH